MTAFGPAPHHERVLAVVLVAMAHDAPDDIQTTVVRPFTPEWDAFWADLGRREVGHNGTREAPRPGECVQPACPTDGWCISNPLARCNPGLRFSPEEEYAHRQAMRREVARQFVPEPESVATCPKCQDAGMIPDPDRGSGWGPYWDEPCDCPAGRQKRAEADAHRCECSTCAARRERSEQPEPVAPLEHDTLAPAHIHRRQDPNAHKAAAVAAACNGFWAARQYKREEL